MLIFYKDNDNLIRWDGLCRPSDGAYVNDATVTFVLKDSDNVSMTSGSMPYVSGTSGRYQGVIDSSVALGSPGDVVWLEATAISGTLKGFRRIQGRIVYRKEN